ncbi:cytochrome P450 [Streptomyces sp. H27-C3]|uniref:cytochrome P450 n=1 Tax=Streptomyces sp. H27-C3 TaxID=3046305 RepID=UPI0024BA4DAD|nr:cytochrome P450 [Streptomyces sp. H27-C3]MDJ0463888.1 cytochrome P450 [Streptomyces sp. H27-C3]
MNPSSHGRSRPGCPVSPGPARLYGTGLGREQPHELYDRLRQRWGPVAPVEIAPGIGAWLVLGHAEVLELIWNEQEFTSDARHWSALTAGLLPMDSPLLPLVGHRPALARLDGHEHRQQRQVVTQTLDLIDLRRSLTMVRQRADALVDSWAVQGGADLISQYAGPLVWGVFAQLLGLPDDSGSRLGSRHIVDGTDEAARAESVLVGVLIRPAAGKRAAPGADLPSWLLAHSTPLTDEEVAHNLVVLLLLGTDSTISRIGNTVRVVLNDSRVSTALATGRLTVSDLVDRALWSDAPVPDIAGRWARADITFAGRRIRAGDLLIPCPAAANADPEVRGTEASGNDLTRD